MDLKNNVKRNICIVAALFFVAMILFSEAASAASKKPADCKTFKELEEIGATAGVLTGTTHGEAIESQFSKILEMIIGIIPSTIVEPFSDGNTLQIIFMAVVFGLSLLFLGKQTSRVAEGIGQLNTLIQYVMSFICKLVPFFIFFIILDLIWSGTISEIAGMWKTLLAGAAVLLLN